MMHKQFAVQPLQNLGSCTRLGAINYHSLQALAAAKQLRHYRTKNWRCLVPS